MAASQNKGTALYASQDIPYYGDPPSERTILGPTYKKVLPPTNISLGFIGFLGQSWFSGSCSGLPRDATVHAEVGEGPANKFSC